MNKVKNILQKICNKYKITLRYVDDDYIKKSNMPRDWYIDSSFVAGNSEIEIGIYEDKEIELISFFHEFGHCRTHWLKDELKYDNEKKCWDYGIKYAKKLCIVFSDKALNWAKGRMNTYIGWEEREVMGWKEKHTKELV